MAHPTTLHYNKTVIGLTDSTDFHFLMIAFHYMAPFLAMAELKRALFCSSGLTKTFHFMARFLAMAELKQASLCSSGLTKTLERIHKSIITHTFRSNDRFGLIHITPSLCSPPDSPWLHATTVPLPSEQLPPIRPRSSAGRATNKSACARRSSAAIGGSANSRAVRQ